MAGENVRPENGNNNKRAVVVSDDPRVVHLEGRVERVEGDVRDIKAGVQKLLDRPQFSGVMPALAGVLTTLLIIGIIFGFAEWRLGQALAAVTVFQDTARQKLDKEIDSLHAAEIRAAVIEERMNWVKDLAKGKTAP